MKRSAIIRIIVFSLIILMLGWLLAAGLARQSHTAIAPDLPNSAATSGKTAPSVPNLPAVDPETSSVSQTASQGITELEIDWVSGSVTVQPGDTDVICYAETGSFDSKYAMEVTETSHKLKIDFCREDVSKGLGFSGGSSIRKDLTITVPRDWGCHELTVDTVSASVNLSGLFAENLEYEGVSGTFTADNCTTTAVSLDTVSGSIQFSGAFDRGEFETTSGSITLTLSEPANTMEIDSVSGGVTVAYPDNCGFTVLFDAVSGNFSSDLAGTTHDDRFVSGDGSCQIRMDSVSGSLNILKKR